VSIPGPERTSGKSELSITQHLLWSIDRFEDERYECRPSGVL
jgi:hypothetical protein